MSATARKPGSPQLLSVTRAAERLDCSRAHIYRLISTGRLRPVDIKATGKRPKTRVYADELDAYIAAQTRTA